MSKADGTSSTSASIRAFLSPQWADIVVVCALEVEFTSLQSVLAENKSIAYDEKLKLKHFILDSGYPYRTLVVRLPQPGAGNVTSGVVTSKLITTYRPWLSVSFGIAGTLKPKKVKLQDVVYAHEIDYVDLRKDLGDRGFVYKSLPQVKLKSTLLELLAHLADHVNRAGSGFGVHEVLLLSSEAVVRSGKAGLRQLANLAIADAEAVEMEAFGVCFSSDWTLYHDEDGPLSVAIKGISDLANARKNDLSHRPAARHAAKFLLSLIEHRRLQTLAELGRFRSLPIIERRRQGDYAMAKRETTTFIGTVRPLLVRDYRNKFPSLEIKLAAAHMTSQRPPIFYHWRLTGQGVHWVDFYFLRVFRQLARLGYPVACLITDDISQMTHNELTTPTEIDKARATVGKIVNTVLRDYAQRKFLVWLSEVSAPEMQSGLKSFVSNSGYDYSALKDILAEPSFAGTNREINYEFDLWFRWIAWSCRHDGVAILLTRPHARIYEYLRLFGTFHPVIVPTDVAQGELDKMDCRGLYLDPPEHPKIHRWIDGEQNAALLAEFLSHLSGDSSLSTGATNQVSDIETLRAGIKRELRKLNLEWFQHTGSETRPI